MKSSIFTMAVLTDLEWETDAACHENERAAGTDSSGRRRHGNGEVAPPSVLWLGADGFVRDCAAFPVLIPDSFMLVELGIFKCRLRRISVVVFSIPNKLRP